MTILYISNGRPEAVCCIYPWQKNLNHDFTSLSRGTLVGKQDGRIFWQPNDPGLKFRPVTGAESPAESAVGRMRQMKEMTKSFASTMLGWNTAKTDREPLRLLPRPLYRYENPAGDVIDGAVFAFVQGTDPESLLLLEALKNKSTPEWQYAFARRTSGELEGRLNGQIVWHAAPYPAQNDRHSTNITVSRPIDPRILDLSRLKDKAP